ncbi:MAG: DNA repair protein RadA [Actinomycetota bacterium]|nr:DNA repair protein RadA [Actinomycetota bacterium]MDQ3681373.1 DNA repair protein RadA [Actinomycetota bacterium]
MTKLRTVHRCTECGGASPRWAGRCGSCGHWNTLVEEASGARLGAADRAVPLCDVDMTAWAAQPTGVAELDRVLGGGLVPGSATLVGGEPGIGKSTLLLQALSSLARRGSRCLLASAEESKQQVRLRAERLGAVSPALWLLAESSLPAIVAAVEDVDPRVVVVDSIQTVSDPEVGSAPGSVAQVRECAHRLVREAKERGVAIVLVGHVTKDGSLAGPRVLEHVVDTVLAFEGDRHHGLRMLRAQKHRFGPVGELGLFDMGEKGLLGVPDPSGLLLGDRREGAAGSVVTPAMEGHRPLLVELQALVSPTKVPMPRRSAQGLDQGRLALVLAVLERQAKVALAGSDVYASAVGGVRVGEPSADLALALALTSAVSGVPLPQDLVACGEVGLTGEVRHTGRLAHRLAEATRLGFRRAVVPASAPAVPGGMELVRAPTLAHALAELGVRPGR